MRNSRYLIPNLIILLSMLVGMGSCSGEDCPINNTVAGKMQFYNQLGDAVAINGTLTVSAVRPQGDYVFLNLQPNASEVKFPLSYTHSTDTLIFDYNQGVVYDTLYISHTNIPTLVSVDCGTAIFHTITAAHSTHNVIDTLIIQSAKVDYDERENIQVIYRTDN